MVANVTSREPCSDRNFLRRTAGIGSNCIRWIEACADDVVESGLNGDAPFLSGLIRRGYVAVTGAACDEKRMRETALGRLMGRGTRDDATSSCDYSGWLGTERT